MNEPTLDEKQFATARREVLLRGVALSFAVRGVLIILLALLPLPPGMEASLPRLTRLFYGVGISLPLFASAAMTWMTKRTVFGWAGLVIEVFTFGSLALILRERALVALGLFLLPLGTLLRMLRVRRAVSAERSPPA